MRKKVLIGGISGFAGIVVIVLGILAYLIFSVAPIQESFTYELGESVSREKNRLLVRSTLGG